MKKFNFLSLSVVAAAGMMLASCSEVGDMASPTNDSFKDRETEYAVAFHQIYGEIAPGTTWDFSQWGTKPATRAGEGATVTKINGVDWGKLTYDFKTTTTTVEKNQKLFNAIYTALPEGKKHEGQPAVLTAPANSFTIYPLTCQGLWTHDLYVKVGDQDEVKVYSKTWTDYSHPFVNGDNVKGSSTKTCVMGGVTINAPVGTPVQVYIKNLKEEGRDLYGKDFCVGTGTGSAIVVPCNLTPSDLVGFPTDVLTKDSHLKFIGIEDNYDKKAQAPGGDRDYNDLVLLVVGNPKTPGEVVIEEDELYIPMAKRYMVEDLGATSTTDIDFNDIVVDVTSYTKYKVTKVDGQVTDYELVENDRPDVVKLRALGGTLKVEMYVDNKLVFTKGQTQAAPGTTCKWNEAYQPMSIGTPYNVGWTNGSKLGDESLINFDDVICTITDFGCNVYNPETNNVWFKVYANLSGEVDTPEGVIDSEGRSWYIVFPKAGQTPKMIAFDPDPIEGKLWRPECVGIDKTESYEWFAY